MLDEKVRYVDIAKEYNVSRNLIPVFIKRYKLNAKHDEHFNKPFSVEEIEALKKIAKENISLTKISLCFGKSKEFIKNVLKENNISLNYSSPMESETLLKCAAIAFESRNLVSSRNLLTVEDLKKLPIMIQQYPFETMCDMLNKNRDAVKKIFNICNLSQMLSCDAILDYEYFDEFEEDMKNPNKSNTSLGYKYGLSLETIRTWRNDNYGDIDTRVSNFFNKSSAELKYEEILKNLDLTFFYQKIIQGYKCDYYLGQKLIIEIQGDYWHSENRNDKDIIAKDAKKKEVLEKAGYIVIQIFERDLKNNPFDVAKITIETYLKSLQYNNLAKQE